MISNFIIFFFAAQFSSINKMSTDNKNAKEIDKHGKEKRKL
jgi:hypothetical protein